MTNGFVLSTPTLYSLELTPSCGNHCTGCGNVFAPDRQPQPLSANQWDQILHILKPHAQFLKLTGGEPTLHPQFAAIVQAVVKTGIPFTLFTNARWRNPHAIIDLLKTAPHTGLLISLHGSDAAAHEAFTHTPGSFQETCENIRRAAAAGLRVHTSTVLTLHNYNRVPEVVALAQSLGARRAVFNRYLGRPLPDLEPDEQQLRRAVRDIEAVRRRPSSFDVKYGNCIPQCFVPSASTGCWAGVAYCTIDPWGNLRPCNHSLTIAGNILKESLETLWQGNTMERWRGLLMEQCEACAELHICHGGCRALTEIRQRDPLIRRPFQVEQLREPVELALYEASRPLLNCTIRSESFGYVLVRGASIIPITFEAKAIVDQCDGLRTLKKIQQAEGQEAVNFVGTLFQQELVTLTT
jgi:AdoMet-dependent heme synthase